MNGEIGGNNGGHLDGFGGFAGEIAMLRFHQDYVLSPSEVYTS